MLLRFANSMLLGVLCAAAAFGQANMGTRCPSANLPDAPSASTSASKQQDRERRLSPHEVLADDPYVRLTSRQKFNHFAHSLYAPQTFVAAGIDTVWSRATGDKRYCCEAAAWGKQYAASLADAETRRFFGYYLFPTLLHQDPRYLPRRRGNFFGRAKYASTRVLVTRNDSGGQAFNSSEFLGVAFARALSNAYYPERKIGAWETFSGILGMLEGDASGNLLVEFMPELKRALKRHAPERIQKIPMPGMDDKNQ